MSRFAQFQLIVIIALTFTSCRTNTQPVVKSQISNAHTIADKIAQQTFDNEKFPGMAVVVWQKGEIIFSESYGYADVESKVPIDMEKSLFRIGSISKPYTAAGLGRLYENGKINLDTPIQTYVPGFPKKEYDVSLRQLAGHLAGIRHYKGSEFMMNEHFPTVAEGLTIFSQDPLIHQPGSKYAYSSYGWNLISAAMESTSGEDFLLFMQNEVFDKIGMTHTHPDYVQRKMKGRVQFYQKGSNNDNQVAPQVDNSYKWAGGGFISSPYDVIKFAQAHLNHTMLKKETVSEWTKSQTIMDGKMTNYGIGWRSSEDQKGRKWYGHSGGSVGGTSMMLVYHEEQMIVVTLVNLGSAKMGNLAFRVANQFL